MSLSQDPAFSILKNYFVCGIRDISNEPWSGVSGKHDVDGQAVFTTNGAGPHNLQLFALASDGTVLTCLPGFWNANDLSEELKFASQLNEIWMDPRLSRLEKDRRFEQMHLSHEHSDGMVRRSRMQGFDKQFEAKNRLHSSDTIADRNLIPSGNAKRFHPMAFKTTDQIMHERMARQPFVPYERFDVVAFSDYGRPKYDKHEDARKPNGEVDKTLARNQEMIGNTAMIRQKRGNARGNPMLRRGMRRMMRQGVSSLF